MTYGTNAVFTSLISAPLPFPFLSYYQYNTRSHLIPLIVDVPRRERNHALPQPYGLKSHFREICKTRVVWSM